MRAALYVLLLSLCLPSCGGLTLPPPIAVSTQEPRPADYPDSPAVVLNDEATLAYRVISPPSGGRPRLVAVLDHYQRVKILREEGLSAATLKLPVDGLTTVTEVVGRAIGPNGTETPLKSGSIRLRRQSLGDGEAVAPEVRILTASQSGAVVGGTVEFRYQRLYLDPWNVPVWTYGGPLPVVHASFGLVADEGIKVDLLHGRGDEAIDRPPSDRDTFQGLPRLRFFELDLPAYFFEPNGSHLAHRSPWTLPALRVARVDGRVERMDGWAEAGKHVLAQMATSEPVHGRGPLLERLSYVRKTLVPQTGLGLGIRAPQSASALRVGTPACSRDAAGFAYGLLSDLGKDVEIVLLTGPKSPPFAESFPSLAIFSRAVLRVRAPPGLKQGLACGGDAREQDYLCTVAPGQWLVVDPSCQSCGAGMVGPGMAGSRALALSSSGQVRWFDVEVGGPEKHSLLVEANYALDVAGGLQGTLVAHAHGQLASQWRQAVTQADTGRGSREAQADPVHYRTLFGDATGPSISGLSVKGMNALERQLTATMSVSAKLSPLGTSGQGLVAADLFGTSLPSEWHSSRRDVMVTDGPSWRDITATIHVPLHADITVPPPVKVANAAFEYASGFAYEGRILRYARRLVMKAAKIAASDWPQIYEGVQAIRAAEARPLPIAFRGD